MVIKDFIAIAISHESFCMRIHDAQPLNRITNIKTVATHTKFALYINIFLLPNIYIQFQLIGKRKM